MRSACPAAPCSQPSRFPTQAVASSVLDLGVSLIDRISLCQVVILMPLLMLAFLLWENKRVSPTLIAAPFLPRSSQLCCWVHSLRRCLHVLAASQRRSCLACATRVRLITAVVFLL